MPAEANKQIIRRWVEGGWNRGDLSLVDQMYAPDYVLHDPSAPGDVTGTAAFKQFVTTFRTALPDFHLTIESMVAEGEMVAWRFSCRGTQRGELMGIPPSGKTATVTGTVTSRFQDGRWAEDFINWDTLGLLRQIGAVPAAA